MLNFIKEHKKVLFLLVVIVLLLIVGLKVAFAYFFTSDDIKNEFTTDNFKVTIVDNLGNFSDTDIIRTKNSYILPTPSKDGYEFLGYSLQEHGSVDYGTEISLNELQDVNNKTLYAQYKIITYIISYDLDGGKVSGNPTTYTVEDDDIEIKFPTKENAKFKGWVGSNGDTPEVTITIPKGSTGNKNYKAIWKYKYKVTYDLGVGDMRLWKNNQSERYSYTYNEDSQTTSLTVNTKTGVFEAIYYPLHLKTGEEYIYEQYIENVTGFGVIGKNYWNYNNGMNLGIDFNGLQNAFFYTEPSSASQPNLWMKNYDGYILLNQSKGIYYPSLTFTAKHDLLYNTLNYFTVTDESTTQYIFGQHRISKYVWEDEPLGFQPYADLNGKTFEGYYTDRNYTTKVDENSLMPNYDVTYYAKFS